jgi:predicted N-acyltransferase
VIFRLIDGVSRLDSASWQGMISERDSPFLEHHWLSAFEDSGAISPGEGWQPLHLVGFDRESDAESLSSPRYALPLYIKSHSWGEFVFDFAWADVASQLGQEYYPKAVGVVPATPVTAYRDINPAGDPQLLGMALEYLEKTLPAMGIRSLSFLFTEDDFAERLEPLGYHRWVHQGFVWTRDEMEDFDAYLARFRKNQRKNIRVERASLEKQELTVRILRGEDLGSAEADDMFDLYEQTNDQFGPWAAKFLNREFFQLAFQRCASQILLVSAEDSGGNCVGRSMLVFKDRRMYGRYWGSRGFHKHLHFNLCYYEPIDFCLREGIDLFDPGMGGEHKIRRGFHGVEQYSMHKYFDPMMDRIFAANIGQFNRQARQIITSVNDSLPQKADY